MTSLISQVVKPCKLQHYRWITPALYGHSMTELQLHSRLLFVLGLWDTSNPLSPKCTLYTSPYKVVLEYTSTATLSSDHGHKMSTLLLIVECLLLMMLSIGYQWSLNGLLPPHPVEYYSNGYPI